MIGPWLDATNCAFITPRSVVGRCENRVISMATAR